MNLNCSSTQHISILGAGLLGRLFAWRLLSLGHSVHLIEQSSFSHPTSAAHTAAAMISPLSEVVVSDKRIYDMGMHSLSLWPQYLEALKHQHQQTVAYSAQGSLVVAHPADEAELEQFQQDLNHHLGRENPAEWLTSAQLSTLEPDIANQFYRALYLPGEAHLDNRALLHCLLKSIKSMGARCTENAKVVFSSHLHCDHPDVTFEQSDLIIDCRGVGAKDQNTEVRGVRGEVLWVHTNEVQLARPIRLMHPRYKLYIVPKPNNQFIIGATEIESQDRSPVSVQSMLELCSALYTLNPAFAEARILELDANLRPSLWDNMPRIDDLTVETSGDPKPMIRINGLYRHGYLLAPHLIEATLQKYFCETS